MLKPVRDNIVLKVIGQETKTAGGLYLPESSLDKPYMGEVVAANDSFIMADGSEKKCEVEVGDIVYFGKSHGTEIKHDGETYLVISEEFILCKE